MLYHWHPHGSSPVVIPHLHLKQGAQVGRNEVRNAHLLTGQVSFSAFVRMLIGEMGVDSIRDDWKTVIDRVEQSVNLS